MHTGMWPIENVIAKTVIPYNEHSVSEVAAFVK